MALRQWTFSAVIVICRFGTHSFVCRASVTVLLRIWYMIEKIFKAYDVRATYPSPLNEEMAWKVGHATAQFLKRSREKLPPEQRVSAEDTMVVGRDMRPSSPDLA